MELAAIVIISLLILIACSVNPSFAYLHEKFCYFASCVVGVGILLAIPICLIGYAIQYSEDQHHQEMQQKQQEVLAKQQNEQAQRDIDNDPVNIAKQKQAKTELARYRARQPKSSKF